MLGESSSFSMSKYSSRELIFVEKKGIWGQENKQRCLTILYTNGKKKTDLIAC
jgi:hypothetical protein